MPSAIAIDTIINQKGGDLTCIYVAIGQQASKVVQVVATSIIIVGSLALGFLISTVARTLS